MLSLKWSRFRTPQMQGRSEINEVFADFMEGWHTTLSMRSSGGINTSDMFRIRRGIYDIFGLYCTEYTFMATER